MDWRLLKAAAQGDTNVLDLTKFHHSDFDKVTPQNNNVLHIAAKHQRLDFASAILHICPSLLLRENNNGDTPLHVAASVGSFEVSKLLINSANQVTSDIENRGRTETWKQLLRSTNKQNDTALNVAIKNGQVNVAKFLVEEDTGLVDMANSNNNVLSPLYLAIERGLLDIADNILERSPLVSGKGPKGMNALHAAVDSDIVSTGFLKRLMEKRPEMIKEVDIIGWTPLHYSVWLGKIEVTRSLLQQDSSAAYISDKEGRCPLHLAASTGQIDAYRELVRCCPYVWEVVDGKGGTSLHSAVISGQRGIIHCILGMPQIFPHLLNESDVDGNTPLHLSVIYKRYAILLLLLRIKRVDKYVMNHNHFTAAELFYSQKQEIGFKVAMAYYALQKYYKQPSQRQNIEKEKKQEKADLEETNTTNDGAMYEVHLLVAVLVATVAFAAAFQLPGGYKPDGTPALMEEAAFKCFLVFDTIAFCFSVTTVYFLFYASRDGFRARSAFLYMSALLMVVSLIAMASAFVSGMYLISSKSRGLALVPFLMAGLFILHGFIYWFLDPRGSYVLGLERSRRFLRKLVFGNTLFHILVRD
ncbi:Protein ACCELERATED CELL DEATH 6 [Cardamine amara subsp. amara]|uniref:Protein ACCELERATED CELL DEATH 6 n=1 Tax=Cardamine amara subsp. amara TaxID=228776 RepID=A0ABD1BBU6_CARAN